MYYKLGPVCHKRSIVNQIVCRGHNQMTKPSWRNTDGMRVGHVAVRVRIDLAVVPTVRAGSKKFDMRESGLKASNSQSKACKSARQRETSRKGPTLSFIFGGEWSVPGFLRKCLEYCGMCLSHIALTTASFPSPPCDSARTATVPTRSLADNCIPLMATYATLPPRTGHR